MVKNIWATGRILQTTITQSDYSSRSGSVRWNSSTNQLEILDESNTSFPAYFPVPAQNFSITIDPEIESAMFWAVKKMKEEQEIERLCQETPALADLRDKFLTMVALTRSSKDS